MSCRYSTGEGVSVNVHCQKGETFHLCGVFFFSSFFFLVPDGLARVFQKLLSSWDFHTLVSRVHTECCEKQKSIQLCGQKQLAMRESSDCLKLTESIH